ncbi:hypothetical protein HDU93_005451, partial [Gonapodya sp. JEL0774]
MSTSHREGSVATEETAGSVHADTDELDDVEMDPLDAPSSEDSDSDAMDTDGPNESNGKGKIKYRSERNEGFKKNLTALRADQH